MTGRVFTRDLESGEDRIRCDEIDGQFDVRFEELPALLRKQLTELKRKLERRYRDAQQFDFEVRGKKVKVQKTRTPDRTTVAAARIAVDMVKQRLIDRKTAVLRLDPAKLEKLLHPQLDASGSAQALATGLAASPGATSGRIAFSAEEAEARAAKGERIILVRSETEASDVTAMQRCAGILTRSGGMTSHAALEARGIGIPCVVGVGEMQIDERRQRLTLAGRTFEPSNALSLDGHSGAIYAGELPIKRAVFPKDVKTILGWADEFRRLQVRANADTPHDARLARQLGAEGIGLCRTEHMFFEGARLDAMREMILADHAEARSAALAKLLPLQRHDFAAIFKEMNGLPVTVRLFDPPLHEFLPHDDVGQQELARKMGLPAEKIRQRVRALHEFNPMLGFRGCRLGNVYPEISKMQARAISEAADEVQRQGVKVDVELMIPLVAFARELQLQRQIVDPKTEFRFGTMIETPRAALTADEIAASSDFVSFGTNDLTQMTLGYSRDDVNAFLPRYLQAKILDGDPFESLELAGVGQLIEMAMRKARRVKPRLKCGICGEHGGDPKSIEFFHAAGLDYVSCSPYRVPIARLAAAHAAIKSGYDRKSRRKRRRT